MRHAPHADELPRTLLALLSVTRTGVGLVAYLAPATGAALLGTDSATAARMVWATRAFAGRDFAVALLGLAAVRAGTTPELKVAALTGALCDGGDALTFLLAVRSGQVGRVRGNLLVVSSTAAAATGVLAARVAAR